MAVLMMVVLSCDEVSQRKEEALQKKELELKLARALLEKEKLELELSKVTIAEKEIPEDPLERQRREEFYGLVPYLEDDRQLKSLFLLVPYKYENKIYTPQKMTILDYISYQGAKYLHVKVNGVKGLLSIPRIDKSDKKIVATLRAYIKSVLKLAKTREVERKAAEYKALYDSYVSRVVSKTLKYNHAYRYSTQKKVEYTFRGYSRHYYSSSHKVYYYYYRDIFSCTIDRQARIPGSSSFYKSKRVKSLGSMRRNESSHEITLYKGNDSIYYSSEKGAVQSYIDIQ